MDTIKQRTPSDCVLCCLAMATGRTYEETAEKLGGMAFKLREKGCSSEDEKYVFESLGLKRDIDHKRFSVSLHWASLHFIRNVLWGRRAIITVRSKNRPDGQHAIYWDGVKLHDPSTKKTYDEWSEVEPMEFVIFSDAPARASDG